MSGALWCAPAHQQVHGFIGPGVHDGIILMVPPVPSKLFHISFHLLNGTCLGALPSRRWWHSSPGSEHFDPTYGPGTIPFMGRTNDAGFIVPHVSIPPNNGLLPLTILFGGSMSVLGSSSVKILTHNILFQNSEADMACCWFPAPISLNLACNDPVPLPSDIVISPCTVEVGVNWADIVSAVIDIAVEFAMVGLSELGGRAIKKLKKGRKAAKAGAADRAAKSVTDEAREAAQDAAKREAKEQGRAKLTDAGQDRVKQSARRGADDVIAGADNQVARNTDAVNDLDVQRQGKVGDFESADAMKARQQTASTELGEAQDALPGARGEADRLKAQADAKHGDIDRLKKRQKNLQKKADALDEQAANARRAGDTEGADRLSAQARETSGQAQGITDDIATEEGNLTRLTEQQGAAVDEVNRLENVIDTRRAELDDLDPRVQEYDDLTRQADGLRAENDRLGGEIADARRWRDSELDRSFTKWDDFKRVWNPRGEGVPGRPNFFRPLIDDGSLSPALGLVKGTLFNLFKFQIGPGQRVGVGSHFTESEIIPREAGPERVDTPEPSGSTPPVGPAGVTVPGTGADPAFHAALRGEIASKSAETRAVFGAQSGPQVDGTPGTLDGHREIGPLAIDEPPVAEREARRGPPQLSPEDEELVREGEEILGPEEVAAT